METSTNSNKKLYILILLVLIAVLGILWYFFGGTHADSRRSVSGLSDPIQAEAAGSEQRSVGGYDITIHYLYSYDIDALVVSTHNYSGGSIGDKLAPKDVALAWGPVAEYNDRIDFHWSQAGRWYRWQVKTYDEIAIVGGVDGVTTHSSNNHLIASDSTVKRQIKKIKAGDHVHLTGYLVNIDGRKSDGSTFWWNSSTTRSDSGDGSCEVFYVTNVEQR